MEGGGKGGRGSKDEAMSNGERWLEKEPNKEKEKRESKLLLAR